MEFWNVNTETERERLKLHNTNLKQLQEHLILQCRLVTGLPFSLGGFAFTLHDKFKLTGWSAKPTKLKTKRTWPFNQDPQKKKGNDL